MGLGAQLVVAYNRALKARGLISRRPGRRLVSGVGYTAGTGFRSTGRSPPVASNDQMALESCAVTERGIRPGPGERRRFRRHPKRPTAWSLTTISVDIDRVDGGDRLIAQIEGHAAPDLKDRDRTCGYGVERTAWRRRERARASPAFPEK